MGSHSFADGGEGGGGRALTATLGNPGRGSVAPTLSHLWGTMPCYQPLARPLSSSVVVHVFIAPSEQIPRALVIILASGVCWAHLAFKFIIDAR